MPWKRSKFLLTGHFLENGKYLFPADALVMGDRNGGCNLLRRARVRGHGPHITHPKPCAALISFGLSASTCEIYFHEPSDLVPLVFFMESANYVRGKRTAIMLNPLSLLAPLYILVRPLPFPDASAGQG